MSSRRNEIVFLVLGAIAVSNGLMAFAFIPSGISGVRPSVIGAFPLTMGVIWATAVFVSRHNMNPAWGSISVLMSVVTGACVMSSNLIRESIIPLLIAGYFLVSGMAMVLYAGQAERSRQWEWVGLAGTLSGMTSLMLLSAPGILGSLLGLNLTASGLGLFMVGWRRPKRKRPWR